MKLGEVIAYNNNHGDINCYVQKKMKILLFKNVKNIHVDLDILHGCYDDQHDIKPQSILL